MTPLAIPDDFMSLVSFDILVLVEHRLFGGGMDQLENREVSVPSP